MTRRQQVARVPDTEQGWPDPLEYEFKWDDFRRWHSRFWRCPDRLVKDGTWGKLWQLGAGVTSVLPVLAVHAQHDDGHDWSRKFTLGQRRIAALSGVSRRTVIAANRVLQRQGLLDLEDSASPSARRAGTANVYRLPVTLFPSQCERFTQVFAGIFYGGVWSVLPRSARGLFPVLACSEPVKQEDSLIHFLELEHAETRWEIKALREAATLSYSDLTILSGQSRRSVANAIRVLTAPVFRSGDSGAPISLFRRGCLDDRVATIWYAAEPDAKTVFLPTAVMNNSRELRAERLRIANAAKFAGLCVLDESG